MAFLRLVWVRAGDTLLGLAYAGIYYACYAYWLHPLFGYAGFEMHDRDVEFMAFSFVIAAVPMLCYAGPRAVSSILSVFVFCVLYVPVVLTFALASSRPVGEIALVQLVFCAGMSLLFLADRLPIEPPVDLRLRVDVSRIVLLATLLLTAYIAFMYRGNLRFAGFGRAVYEQRMATADVGGGVLTRYLSVWLGTVLVPICLAHGLVARRWWYVLTGTAACVVVYMGTAAKIVILFPVVFAAFYFTFRHGRLRHFFPIFTVGLGAFVAFMALFAKEGSTLFLAGSLLMQRTLGNGGELMVEYYDFFSFFPQTNYTHINLVRMFVDGYPYGSLGIGQVVGQYVFDPNMNANASFWATDGLAAIGLPGVLVASVACALVFVAVNSLTRGYDRLFVALVFLPFVTQLLNTSLFQSMWSGGGLLLLTWFVLNGRRAAVADPDTSTAFPAVAAPT